MGDFVFQEDIWECLETDLIVEDVELVATG